MSATHEELRTDVHVDVACARIAPTWPLDRFIAVNPYWGWLSDSIHGAAATLGILAGTRLTMPLSWFAGEWGSGRLTREHLLETAAAHGDPALADEALAALREGDALVERLPLVTDLRDTGPGPRKGQSWTDLVTHQISQHCAAHFDRDQGSWHPEPSDTLFASWKRMTAGDRAIPWRRTRRWARAQLDGLPNDGAMAVDVIVNAMRVPEDGRAEYLTALLLSINGWGAWCAHERWSARLDGGDSDTIVQLLAIRLTWDWLLREDGPDTHDIERWDQWTTLWAQARDQAGVLADRQRMEWFLQEAVERAYQRHVIAGLQSLAHRTTTACSPIVQAVFCIDVRSEVFRRALESATPAVATRGFAGFFGLPISYTPAGSALTRPQLPGLLAPAMNVTEATAADVATLAQARSNALQSGQRWRSFRTAPSSVFSFVESMGLTYGLKLVTSSLANSAAPQRWENTGLGAHASSLSGPRLPLVHDDPENAAAIGRRVLAAMGLVEDFAALVLLCGHGSQTANNPHAAGLDCGACGGQSGEVNARVLAQLLNDPAVRTHLSKLGIDVPTSTYFIAGLHNTTTDDVQLFDTDRAPTTHHREIAQLHDWLAAAGHVARSERAASLGLSSLAGNRQALDRAVREFANDWSQVRPEWGLAGNAAFVVAPRSRTRHLNLAGRSFLHDYDWQHDPDLAVLTQIMTAPMVVTNWINMQYFASTVDNGRYGSGNKVLHNVVGGHIGVFEGNGGDLRIGLSMQSLHDGVTLRHPPLRLSVFIEAPRTALDSVIAAQRTVRDLVANGWLHLMRIEPGETTVERWTAAGWQ